jgi:Cu/Ag efflux protein CusF
MFKRKNPRFISVPRFVSGPRFISVPRFVSGPRFISVPRFVSGYAFRHTVPAALSSAPSGAAVSEFAPGLNMPPKLNSLSPHLALFCLLALLTLSQACNRGTPQPTPANPQPTAKRYPLTGKVISVDKQAGSADINNDPIPGFMDPMVMPYPIKPPAAVEQLQPGDSITAEVVVAEPGKYWLENVKITGHAKPAPSKPSASSRWGKPPRLSPSEARRPLIAEGQKERNC